MGHSRAGSRVGFAAQTYPQPTGPAKTLAPNAGTSGPTPTFTPGAQAGTGATTTGSRGNDNAGTIIVHTGTGASVTGGNIVLVDFASPMTNPSVVVTAQGSQAAALNVSVAVTNLEFVLFTTAPIPSSSVLVWSYVALGS